MDDRLLDDIQRVASDFGIPRWVTVHIAVSLDGTVVEEREVDLQFTADAYSAVVKAVAEYLPPPSAATIIADGLDVSGDGWLEANDAMEFFVMAFKHMETEEDREDGCVDRVPESILEEQRRNQAEGIVDWLSSGESGRRIRVSTCEGIVEPMLLQKPELEAVFRADRARRGTASRTVLSAEHIVTVELGGREIAQGSGSLADWDVEAFARLTVRIGEKEHEDITFLLQLYDSDGDGWISLEDVATLMLSTGWPDPNNPVRTYAAAHEKAVMILSDDGGGLPAGSYDKTGISAKAGLAYVLEAMRKASPMQFFKVVANARAFERR